jgi:hypothetical protein
VALACTTSIFHLLPNQSCTWPSLSSSGVARLLLYLFGWLNRRHRRVFSSAGFGCLVARPCFDGLTCAVRFCFDQEPPPRSTSSTGPLPLSTFLTGHRCSLPLLLSLSYGAIEALCDTCHRHRSCDRFFRFNPICASARFVFGLGSSSVRLIASGSAWPYWHG